MLIQDLLPPHIWEIIYSYDPTYRNKFVECQRELKKNITILMRFACPSTRIKRLTRTETKEDLIGLCQFLHIKVPKHVTKKTLVFAIHSYLSSLIVHWNEDPESPIH